MYRPVSLIVLAAALTASAVLPAGTAPAQPDHRPAALQVVLEGLDTPRGLAWDPQLNRVLITEAGRGGPAPCAPGVGDYPACFGRSGAITAYSPDGGRAERLATGLPSVINEFSVLGLHDIDVHHGRISVVFGLGGRMSTRDGLGADAFGLAHTAVISRSGEMHPVGDLLEFEQTNNPHPTDVNANAYGLVTGPFGTIVAEAGGNDILHVTDEGEVTMLAVLPDQIIDGTPVESVPTTVAIGPDGAFYIGEYSGEPTSIGVARIWRLVPGSQPTVLTSGFTGIIDLAFDRQGRMLVLELAEQGFDSPDKTGRLVRIEPDGTHTVLAREGLEHPGGVEVAPDGDLYITNRTTGLGDNSGQLLRLRPRR